MRILFLCHRVPYPPTKGDKIRAFQEIRSLAARGHLIDILAFVDDPEDASVAGGLEKLAASVRLVPLRPWRARFNAARALLAGHSSLSVAYFADARMRRLAADHLQLRPDVVVAYSGAMTQYVPAAWRHAAVADLVDADSEKWRLFARSVRWPMSWVYRAEAERLARLERAVARHFARTLVCSPREARSVAAGVDGGPSGLDIVTLGVDLTGLEPSGDPAPRDGPPEILFVGDMRYLPNVDAVQFFARDVMPLVRARVPGATFFIVGRQPGAAVRRLARVPGVVVTGTVADVRPYIQRAAVCVAPLRIACGLQHKVLQSMAGGRATVVTPAAADAFEAVPGEHVLVASSAREFADSVVRLLGDPAERRRLGENALRFVRGRHDADAVHEQFVSIVEDVAAGALGSDRGVQPHSAEERRDPRRPGLAGAAP